MAGNGKQLTARQEKALLSLLTEPSIEAAATAAKVGARTLHTWLRDPVFSQAYRAMRAAAVAQAVARLQQSSSKAVDALTDIMADVDAPAPARVAAAKTVLEMAIKGTELAEMQRRLVDLEQARDTLPQDLEEEQPIVSVD